MATLYMLIGISGSGKSTYANSLKEKLGNSCEIFSSDKIREELYGDESCQNDPKKVFSILHHRAIDLLLEDKDVICDATNLKRKNRRTFIREIKDKIPESRIEAILFLTPVEECINRRNQEGKRKVSKGVIIRQLCQFQVPYYDEGFDDIKYINYFLAQEAKDYFSNLSEKAAFFDQENPHHSDNLLDHCMKVSKMTKPMKVGMLHDFGKLYTKTYDDKGIAHYYGHESASAYIYLLIFLVSSKDILEKRLQEALAIEYHMRTFYFQSHKKYCEWKKNYVNLKTRLIMNSLLRADKKSHMLMKV